MAIYKRWKGKKVARNSPNWNKAKWVAEGQLNGVRYLKSLPTAKTAKDAEAEELKIRSAIANGEDHLILNKTTFSDFVDNVYWPHAEQKNVNLKAKATEVKHLKKHFRNLPLRNINVAACERYKLTRSKDMKECQACRAKREHECAPQLISPSSVNRELTTLSRILQLACYHHQIKENPMRYVEKLREPDSRARFLKNDERKQLLDTLLPDKRLIGLVLIALLTGWRKKQILALSKSAMDAETKTVALTRSKQQKPRRMPVSDAAWAVLERLAEDAPDDWLFPARRTTGHRKDFTKAWKTMLKKAGIEDFRFHDLRRSAATDLLRLGADAFTIRDVLGHANIDTTAIYARTQESSLRDALNKAGSEYDEWVN